ncbi:MAG: ABC transporter ATP-binding protein [Thermoguttaceae bacterium]|jgi:ABC-2 type transport system ATP-binding protein
MDSIIRLKNVSKRFGAELALDDVSFEVPNGVVFALLGENGAGKTTAIRIMLGLADANSGRAEVLGLPSAAQGIQIRRRVGYVPERPTLYEWMTVDEIGWFTAGFYGNGFLPEYARLTAGFGLSGKKKISHLSKGARAKVLLSLALANQPDLLILDEPTSGLDAMVRREFLENMVDRAAAGKTVFLSSHQIAEVERVADIIAILRKGRLILVERLDELKSQVRKLTVTMKDGAMDLPQIRGEILSRRLKQRQWQLIARGISDEQLSALNGHENVRALEVVSTNLEEIFIAYMQQENGAAVQTAAKEDSVP